MKKIFLFIPTFISSIFSFSISHAQVTFDYTGAEQFYVVPGCVDSVTVDVIGAEGGSGPAGCTSGNFKLGGEGGRVQATIPVTSGDTLFIYVGGKGEDDDLNSAAGGFNGGGDAETDDVYSYYGGGGGGGASDIRLNGHTLNDRIVVAGGGGGAGADGCNCEPLRGGDGGDLIGSGGEAGASCGVCEPSGQGGTQSAGGTKGDWACTCNAQDGSLGQGGASNSTSCGGPTGGGGGGGGYYGGGGGGLGAGGGGSSYVLNTATSVTHTQGYQTGNGSVTITAVGGLSLSVTVSPNDSVCAGTNVTLTGNGADGYFWNNGIQNGVPFKANESTLYTLVGINSNECTDSLQVFIYVYPPSSVGLTIQGNDTLCVFDNAVTLTGLPPGGTYSGAGVTGNSFDPGNANFNAWNVITYTVADINGCINDTQDSVYVTGCLGIDNVISDEQISIHPNPGDGKFTINAPFNGEIILYNVIGEIISKQAVTKGINQLDIEKEADGIYSLKFIGKNVQVIRLVKN